MTETLAPVPAGRRYGSLLLKLAVSAALLVFLFTEIDASRLWAMARKASLPWLAIALTIYALNVIVSAWRWRLLLEAQRIPLTLWTLLRSYLVANFFNNFLPSNIGGDVVRIRDTAGPARSTTLATTVVLVDRGLGLMALLLIAAVGASMETGLYGSAASPVWPSWLWAVFFVGAAVTAPAMYSPAGVGRLLQPLAILHPEWIGARIDTLISTLDRFRERPSAIFGCFSGAIVVQGLMVVFYMAVVHALNIPVTIWSLAVIVPISIVVQMAPVSVNGLGLREATFSFYFRRLGLPIESALLLSLAGAALTMLFSLTGAGVYVSRGH